MKTRLPALLVVLAMALLSTPAAAQGTQRVLGGGCGSAGTPVIGGSLNIGTVATLEDAGCFFQVHGTAIAMFGIALPTNQWFPIPLVTNAGGLEICDLVAVPLAGFDVTNLRFPVNLPIPLDPTLRGQSLSLQFACNQCGFAGCYPVLTKALELTFG